MPKDFKKFLTNKLKSFTFSEKLPLAVDIGSSGIKILQLAKKHPKGKLEIVCIDKEEYPFNQKLSLFNSQRQALQNLIKRNKVNSQAITCLPVSSLRVYNLTFPQMPQDELKEALHWKIERLEPFGLNFEAIKYGFINFDTLLQGEFTEQKILLICVPKKTLEERLRLLKEAGLKTLAVGIEPCAFINSYTYAKDESLKNEVVIGIDFDLKESTLIIFKGGVLCFFKPLALTSSYAANLENLVVDIEHSFKYFSYQVAKSRIAEFDRVILFGNGSKLKNLDRFLQTKLSVPIEKIDCFAGTGLSSDIAGKKKHLFAGDADFAVCIGLAIPHQAGIEQIDFLPKKEEKFSKDFFVRWLKANPYKSAALVLILFVLLISLQLGRVIFYGRKMKTLSAKVKTVGSQLTRLQSKRLTLTKEEGQLQEKNVNLKARLDFLKAGLRKPEEFSKMLLQIATLLPEEVWVTELTYSKNELNITGSTPDIKFAMQILESLKLSKFFTDATFIYSQKEAEGKLYRFEITAEVNNKK